MDEKIFFFDTLEKACCEDRAQILTYGVKYLGINQGKLPTILINNDLLLGYLWEIFKSEPGRKKWEYLKTFIIKLGCTDPNLLNKIDNIIAYTSERPKTINNLKPHIKIDRRDQIKKVRPEILKLESKAFLTFGINEDRPDYFIDKVENELIRLCDDNIRISSHKIEATDLRNSINELLHVSLIGDFFANLLSMGPLMDFVKPIQLTLIDLIEKIKAENRIGDIAIFTHDIIVKQHLNMSHVSEINNYVNDFGKLNETKNLGTFFLFINLIYPNRSMIKAELFDCKTSASVLPSFGEITKDDLYQFVFEEGLNPNEDAINEFDGCTFQRIINNIENLINA